MLIAAIKVILTTVLIILLLYFSIFSAIPVYHLARFWAGKVSGYNLVSITFFRHTWLFDKNNKITKKRNFNKFNFFNIVMSPPDDYTQFKFKLYLLSGGFANITLALILKIILSIFISYSYLFVLLNIVMIINTMAGFVSLLPLKFLYISDSVTLIEASKSEYAKRGLYLMYYIHNRHNNGTRWRDFPAETFLIDKNEDIYNFLISNILVCESFRLYDIGEYHASAQIYEQFDINKFNKMYHAIIKNHLIYYYCLHNYNPQRATQLYNELNMNKFAKYAVSIKATMTLRILTAYEFFISKNLYLSSYYLGLTEESIKHIPYKGSAIMESEYLDYLKYTISSLQI